MVTKNFLHFLKTIDRREMAIRGGSLYGLFSMVTQFTDGS